MHYVKILWKHRDDQMPGAIIREEETEDAAQLFADMYVTSMMKKDLLYLTSMQGMTLVSTEYIGDVLPPNFTPYPGRPGYYRELS